MVPPFSTGERMSVNDPLLTLALSERRRSAERASVLMRRRRAPVKGQEQ